MGYRSLKVTMDLYGHMMNDTNPGLRRPFKMLFGEKC